jgi:pyrrolidone-carboxylate peptidase
MNEDPMEPTSPEFSDQPMRPIDDGGGDPPPPPPPPSLSLNGISPIAGALAGGINITLNGSGFQPGAEVYFGSSPSPAVTVESSVTAYAQVPPATQTGTVPVTIVNPNGATATVPGGFTYVTMDDSGRAEVIGVDPLAVIEATPTDITLRGRNLIAAYNSGLVVLRAPARASVAIWNVRGTTDAATGIEELTVTVNVVVSPALAPHERLVVQVLASSRPGALNDGLFESSRQLFTVLPHSVPVMIGYSSNLDPNRPNLVVVMGRNLEGCALELGSGATVHMQRSSDDVLAGVVTVSNTTTTSQLSVNAASGAKVAEYSMSVASSPQYNTLKSTDQALAYSSAGVGAIDLALTPAPGQQMLAPSEQDATVVNLNTTAATSLSFNWANFEVSVFDLFFRFRIINIVRLIPFFDGGGDQLETPVMAQVGRLFRVRGVGLLFALRVEITITITVVIIIGFRYDIWGYGLFNEFPEFGWGIGSFVIGFRIEISIDISIHSLTALVLPGGRLQVLAVFDLEIGIDFTISNNGLHLHFDPRFTHKVIFREIKPLHSPFVCDGRFQLAEENGRTVFPDAFGGYQSFYFAHAPGECCFTWRFDFELVRFTPGGIETTVQQPFNADLCLNAAPSPGLANIIITSENPAPTGVPPRLEMTFNDRATLRCLAQPVDAAGNPTGSLQDVTTLGYNVEFYLDPFAGPDVLDPTLIGSGDAAPVLAGDNLIHVRIWPKQGEIQMFTFWPGAVSGFAIASMLARGLPPAVIGSNPLPVTVQNPTQIVVVPTLVFRDPQNPNVPTESPSLFTLQQEPVREVERYEPFEAQQLEYVLAVKLNFPSNYSFPTTLRFRVTGVAMKVLKSRGTTTTVTTTPVDEPPLANTGFPGRQSDMTASHFFEKLVQLNQEFTLNLSSRPAANTPIELATFKIAPNTKDEVGQSRLVPPGRLVADREVMLLIELAESSGAPVSNIKQLKLVVRNDETYEEYVRVFPEARAIVNGAAAFQNFVTDFLGRLPAEGPPAPSILETKGRDLWNLAVGYVQMTKDDRPLYWARLQSIGALRAYYKRKRLGTPPVTQFEWPSRGLEQADGRINFGSAAGLKAIVTGFDPFALSSQVDASNLSGLIALALNNRTFNTTRGPVFVRTAIMPVRYRDFDARIVENAVEPNLNQIELLMTCSQGGVHFEVERFASKNRGAFKDNELKPNTGTPIPGTNLTDPGLSGPQFLESTLPYERVITSDITTRTGLPFSAAHALILDQSFDAINPIASNPPPNSVNDVQTWKKLPFVIMGTAIRGSGDNFLSNEIFYRTALLRSNIRPALPSGHVHVPVINNQPQMLGPGFVTAAETVLVRFLNDRLRLRSLGDVLFPNTAINRTSAALPVKAMNETAGVVTVNSVEIDPPQGFLLQTPVPIDVSPSSELSVFFTFSPTEVREYASVVRFRDAAGEILFSATLSGTGISLPPTPQISGFDPTAGELGDSFSIFGVNFTGATAVRIGTLGTTFVVMSDTEIIADVSGPPRLAHVSVDTPSGTAVSSGSFRVIRPPREPIL